MPLSGRSQSPGPGAYDADVGVLSYHTRASRTAVFGAAPRPCSSSALPCQVDGCGMGGRVAGMGSAGAAVLADLDADISTAMCLTKPRAPAAVMLPPHSSRREDRQEAAGSAKAARTDDTSASLCLPNYTLVESRVRGVLIMCRERAATRQSGVGGAVAAGISRAQQVGRVVKIGPRDAREAGPGAGFGVPVGQKAGEEGKAEGARTWTAVQGKRTAAGQARPGPPPA
jgi:hypothetical protein